MVLRRWVVPETVRPSVFEKKRLSPGHILSRILCYAGALSKDGVPVFHFQNRRTCL